MIGKFPAIKTAEARTIATELLGQIGRGIDPVVQKKREKEKAKPDITLRKALESYKADKILAGQLKERTAKSKYGYDFDLYAGELLDLPLTQITYERIKSLVRTLLEEKPRHTSIQIFLRGLSAVLSYANSEFFQDSLFPTKKNPATLSQKIVRRSEPRTRVLSRNELKALFGYLYARSSFSIPAKLSSTGDYFLFTLLTGCRRMEAAPLKWSNIKYLEPNIVRVRFEKTKTEPFRDIFFSHPFLTKLLEKRRESGQEYVFPGPGRSGHIAEPKNLVQRFLKENTEIPSFSIHDLRRTFVTYGLTAGNTEAVDAIIGHKSQTVTGKHYAHFTDDQKSEVLNAIIGVILEACGYPLSREKELLLS